MSIAVRTAVATALVVGLIPSVGAAKQLHRHTAHARHFIHAGGSRYGFAPGYGYADDYGQRHGSAYGPTSADPYPLTAADDPYNPYAPPGAAIRALARRNQNAPGVTNELAPDNIATATGGPSGGVPGFSGH